MAGNRTSVAVFAHNEAERIGATLQALSAAGLGADDTIHVLINGSTDNTEAAVRAVAAQDPRIVPHVIAFGDKSNAWNTYVYRIAAAGDDHVFLDGDVTPSRGAVAAMLRTAAAHPEALGISALPQGGRSSAAWSARILAHHGMPGNLYLLPARTLARIRQTGFFMPVGLIGDDTFLRFAVLRDFDAKSAVENSRIRPCAEAHFAYSSFPLTTAKGLTALVKRQRRYARRDLQIALLTQHALTKGFGALPPYMADLYAEARPWTALRDGWRPRTVLVADAYGHARRNRGVRPQGDPFRLVFEKADRA